jgi:hypothetical protein
MIHFGNAAPHKSQTIEKWIDENEDHRPDHHPYSSNLAPIYFYLNEYLNEKLKDHSCLDLEIL